MNPGTTSEAREASSGFRFPWLLLLLAGIYVIPFVAILLDEKVFGTFWFSRHLPEKASEFLRTAYPFYKLFY